MNKTSRDAVKAVCRERDIYKKALELIAATDRRRVAMMGVLAVADCMNIAKNALAEAQDGEKK